MAMEATGVYWKPVYYGLEGLVAERLRPLRPISLCWRASRAGRLTPPRSSWPSSAATSPASRPPLSWPHGPGYARPTANQPAKRRHGGRGRGQHLTSPGPHRSRPYQMHLLLAQDQRIARRRGPTKPPWPSPTAWSPPPGTCSPTARPTRPRQRLLYRTPWDPLVRNYLAGSGRSRKLFFRRGGVSTPKCLRFGLGCDRPDDGDRWWRPLNCFIKNSGTGMGVGDGVFGQSWLPSGGRGRRRPL